MGQMLRRLFIDHPQSVDENYGEHARFALGFAGMLFLAALAALVHAILPGVFEKTASNIVHRLAQRTANRGR